MRLIHVTEPTRPIHTIRCGGPGQPSISDAQPEARKWAEDRGLRVGVPDAEHCGVLVGKDVVTVEILMDPKKRKFNWD